LTGKGNPESDKSKVAGFTETLRVAGVFPPVVPTTTPTVSMGSTSAVKATGVSESLEMLRVWAAGAEPPTLKVKVSELELTEAAARAVLLTRSRPAINKTRRAEVPREPFLVT
jgi:hypothetical protein